MSYRRIVRRWALPVIVGWWMLISWVVIILPASGTVVDQGTGRPIAHAVVLATWTTEKLGLESMQYAGNYRVVEVETNAEGVYRIPGWVGLDIKSPFRWRSVHHSPDLIVYSPGYRFDIAYNRGRSHFLMVRGSQSNGTSIPLARVKPPVETTYGYLSDDEANSDEAREIARRGMTGWVDGRIECRWDRYAKILSAMWRYEESAAFTAKATRYEYWPGILRCHQENLFPATLGAPPPGR